eukprot:COSAG02_NODE_25874_length_646_cov_2.500914_1_plen_209_part_10
MFGIECQECEGETTKVDDARTSCTSCAAGKEPNAAKTGCVDCTDNQYSTFGVCQDCVPPNVVSGDRTSCGSSICPPGTTCPGVSCASRSDCIQCPVGSISSGGACEPCTEPGKRANDDQTACESCGAGTQPSLDNATCVACSDLPGAKFSMFGIECQECEGETTKVDDARTSCTSCAAGKEPSATKTGCVDCIGNRVSSSGSCEECPAH